MRSSELMLSMIDELLGLSGGSRQRRASKVPGPTGRPHTHSAIVLDRFRNGENLVHPMIHYP